MQIKCQHTMWNTAKVQYWKCINYQRVCPETWTSSFWKFESLKVWKFESLKAWKLERLEAWRFERLNAWTLERTNAWTLERLNGWKLESLKAWTPESLKAWKFESLTAWKFESLKVWKFEVWTFESLNAWKCVSLKAWKLDITHKRLWCSVATQPTNQDTTRVQPRLLLHHCVFEWHLQTHQVILEKPQGYRVPTLQPMNVKGSKA